jgi:23S rRNA (uridine2552-2'-O)-methyltransferase
MSGSDNKGGGKTPNKTPGKSSGKRKPKARETTKRVKTARGRKNSSTRWLQRQLNDTYVSEAQRLGYRSRAAFKLIGIDDKTGILKKGQTVIDLGAAPGGWLQVAVERGATKVIGIDLLPVDPLGGVTFLQMDFMDEDAPEALINALGEGADIVMSDMAPNTTGHKDTDHLRIMALVEAAYEFAYDILKQDGVFISKVFQGGAQSDLIRRMKMEFKTVKHIKPPASRKESSEQFIVAQGFKADKRDAKLKAEAEAGVEEGAEF